VAAFVIQEDLVNVVAVEIVVIVYRVVLLVMPMVYYHRHLNDTLDPQVQHPFTAVSFSTWSLPTVDLLDLDVLVGAFVA